MDALTLTQSQRLIHFACRKWVKAFELSGSSFDYEDLVQEATIVYLNAAEKFDPSKNLAFSTYLTVSITHRLSGLFSKNSRFDHYSLSAHEEFTSLEESLKDVASNPELELEAAQSVEGLINGLSPLAKAIEKLSILPPEFLKAEFEALNAKRKIASDWGIDERYPTEINLNFVSHLLSLLGVSSSDIARAKTEIRNMELENV
jgi:RNA polymerase sigma factor (sigma-70 family)